MSARILAGDATERLRFDAPMFTMPQTGPVAARSGEEGAEAV